MRQHRRFVSAWVVVAWLTASAAQAQDTAAQPPLVLPRDAPMTMPEYQAVSCAVAGVLTSLGAVVYLDQITAAAATVASPWLLLPVLATGFTVGCSVGSTVSPALLWLYRRH